MDCRTEVVDGKEVEWCLPEAAPAGIILFLHGYDSITPTKQPRLLEGLADDRLACLSPIGPQCWWTPEIYPPFDSEHSPLDFIRNRLLPLMEERFPAETPFLGVVGIEMGGQGALQLGYRWPMQFRRVAAISPKVDFETWYGHGTSLDQMFSNREAARQQTATLHLNPLHRPVRQFLCCDPQDLYCFDGVQTLASKLSSSGVPYESDFSTSLGGYGWPYFEGMWKRALKTLVESA